MTQAILRCARALSAETLEHIQGKLEHHFHKKLQFEVTVDPSLIGGFVVLLAGKRYDMSVSAQLGALKRRQYRETGEDPNALSQELLAEMQEILAEPPRAEIYGTVESVMDDVVQVQGLSGVHNGELLGFECANKTHYGLAMDLHEDGAGVVMLSGSTEILPGGLVRATGRVADICVGTELLGRVINPIGEPLDGRALKTTQSRPVECAAPSIMERSPVNQPMETGLLAIDSMIPVGRGQRELIIGDRQTGKTAIALAAMINQKEEDTYCVYCAIGQKGSTVAQVVETLKRNGVMERCVVVSATADDRASLQYLAPYAGCSIAEYFMHQGKDVLIVYDDLSRHAQAYRSMSLLLRRPSGREAYPGDVFYLHSRLLERAARLSDELGGGSITALPIVETMAGDISAYIPTNVISITDGQIYLESELFHAGVRPALNVGLSVSRVGRAAQHAAMRAVSGSLRLDLAQYRDTAIFAQFGADIDESTQQLLRRGERLTQLLRQSKEDVMSLAKQVAVLLAFSEGLFEQTEPKEIIAVRTELFKALDLHCGGVMQNIQSGKALSDPDRALLLSFMKKFLAQT